MKSKIIALTALAAAALLPSGCAKNPVTGKSELSFISKPQEIALGEESYFLMQQAQGGAYVACEEVQEYVKKIGLDLASLSDRPDLPYDFVVLNDSIPNAWALPGGKIAINRGLLVELQSEAELAAVLSHEIVHSAARHGAKSVERGLLMQSGMLGLHQLLKEYRYQELAIGSASLAAGLVSLKYSRGAELEADHFGIKYMVAAGYDPEAAVCLQETFLRLSEDKSSNWFFGLFATHPPSAERIRENGKTCALYPTGGKRGEKEYGRILSILKEKEPAYQKLDQGYEALRDGEYEKALCLANEAIAIEPKEAHLYNLKGKAEKKLKRYADAEKSFEQAVERNPDYFDFYLQRGLLAYHLDHHQKAKEDLEESLSLFPTSPAHYALGQIAFKEGRYMKAREHFRLAGEEQN